MIIHSHENISSIVNGNKELDTRRIPKLKEKHFRFPTISILNFGATGDGTTDDTSAVQSAINSLTNGGTIYFPDAGGNKYLITDTIELKDNITVYMETGAEIVSNMGWIAAFSVNNKKNIIIDNLFIEGSALYHIWLLESENVLIKNSTLLGPTHDALIHVQSSDDIRIDNCQLSNAVMGVRVNTSSNVVVENCQTYNTTRAGLRVQQGCSNVSFINNHIIKAMQDFNYDGAMDIYGYTLTEGEDPLEGSSNNNIYFIGNTIEGTGSGDPIANPPVDLRVKDTSNFYFLNNTVYSNNSGLYSSIHLHSRGSDSCENLFFEGNTFHINHDFSVSFMRITQLGLKNLVVKDNIIKGSAGTDIFDVRVAVEDFTLQGNVVDVSDGIFLIEWSIDTFSKNISITENEVRTNDRSIAITNTDGIIIDDNYINSGSSTEEIIGIIGSDNIVISNNTLEGINLEMIVIGATNYEEFNNTLIQL